MAWFTNDLETIEEMFGWGTMMLVDALFLSVIVIIKMIRLEWVLSLIIFIPIILIIVWGALVEKHMSLRWENRQKAFDDLYDFSQENFTGIRVIKAFVKETQELHAFAKVAKKNQDANINFVKTSVVFDVFISLIISAILALLLGVGGYFAYAYMTGNPVVLFGHTVALDAGLLVTFVGTFDYLIWPMMALGQIVSMRSRAKASLRRIDNFLDQEEEIQNPENAIVLSDVKGKITFNDYSFNYPGSKEPSLKNITFEINAGETIGIVGKIGSGKSTLVNSLLRMYNIDENSILIDGIDLMHCDIDSLRNAIGYVPQDNFLFSDKVRNNIAFSNKALEYEKVELAAKFADVHDNIIGFKDGYDTISGERGVTLSGGQKQRLMYESKIVYRTEEYGDKVRTFCMNPKGAVVNENTNGIITVNGHSYEDPAKQTENTNFALLVAKHFSEPFKDSNGYGESIARLSNMLGGGVIVQRFGDLIRGRRSTPSRIEEAFITPTLNATPGDLSLVLPKRILDGIIEMIYALDKVAPGTANDDTLLYGVEVKFYNMEVEVNTKLESRYKGLYIIGDGSGITHSLSHASASGVHVARSITESSAPM